MCTTPKAQEWARLRSIPSSSQTSGTSFFGPINPWLLISKTPEQLAQMRAEREAKTPEGMITRISSLEDEVKTLRSSPQLTPQQQQLISSGAKLGTIQTAKAQVKQKSTAQRTPQRVRPIRTGLETTYGTRSFPSESTTGLNVPQ